MINKENVESGIVYAGGWVASHMTLDDATKIVVLITFALRATYDGVRLYRYLKKKEPHDGNAN